ncbi:MAG: Eukaryotic translation initiation factor 3 subunit E [Paramarteilia canceri]
MSDLKQILPTLNSHLAIRVIDLYLSKEVSSREFFLKAKLNIIINGTRMADFAIDTYSQLYPDKEIPEYLSTFKTKVQSDINSINLKTSNSFMFFSKSIIEDLIASDQPQEDIVDKLSSFDDFDAQHVQNLYEHTIFLFSIGNNYQQVCLYSSYLQKLVPKTSEVYEHTLWLQLISFSLLEKWDEAHKASENLNSHLLEKYGNDQRALSKKLIELFNTNLFIYFNHENGLEFLIENMYTSNESMNALISLSPYLIKYLIAALIITVRKLVDNHSTIVGIITSIKDIYSDPFIDFIQSLYIDYNLSKAPTLIKNCHAYMKENIFLAEFADVFKTNASMLYVFSHFKLFRKGNFTELSQKLDLDENELKDRTEKLISDKKLSAKINGNYVEFSGEISNTKRESLLNKFQEMIEEYHSISD